RVVHLFEFRIITHAFDAFLGGNDLVVASHHYDSAELKALGEVHGADGNLATDNLNIAFKNVNFHSRSRYCRASSIQFSILPDQNTDFVREYAVSRHAGDPLSNGLGFMRLILADKNARWWAIEHGDGASSLLNYSVNIGHFRAQQAIRLHSN